MLSPKDTATSTDVATGVTSSPTAASEAGSDDAANTAPSTSAGSDEATSSADATGNDGDDRGPPTTACDERPAVVESPPPQWVNVTGNLANLASECGNLTMLFWESGIYNGGGLYRTDDGGLTFVQLGDFGHNDLISVDFSDPERKTLLAGSHEQTQRLMRTYKTVYGGFRTAVPILGESDWTDDWIFYSCWNGIDRQAGYMNDDCYE